MNSCHTYTLSRRLFFLIIPSFVQICCDNFDNILSVSIYFLLECSNLVTGDATVPRTRPRITGGRSELRTHSAAELSWGERDQLWWGLVALGRSRSLLFCLRSRSWGSASQWKLRAGAGPGHRELETRAVTPVLRSPVSPGQCLGHSSYLHGDAATERGPGGRGGARILWPPAASGQDQRTEIVQCPDTGAVLYARGLQEDRAQESWSYLDWTDAQQLQLSGGGRKNR